jgi:hypothetical protein
LSSFHGGITTQLGKSTEHREWESPPDAGMSLDEMALFLAFLGDALPLVFLFLWLCPSSSSCTKGFQKVPKHTLPLFMCFDSENAGAGQQK